MSLAYIVALVGEITVLTGVLAPIVAWVSKLVEASKCQLRTEMLRIYYHNKDLKKIRQYEYENFVFLYEAYKALKGNSFIDKIYAQVKTWEIIT